MGRSRDPRTGSRLRDIGHFGQSVWLDYVRRDLIASGGLATLIDADGVTGLTSNPSIFEKAIAQSDLYDGEIAQLIRHGIDRPGELFERVAIADIQAAADALRPVYDRSGGADGYASLEVSPYLAHDTAATVLEAHRLWQAVNRPNLMIKVPATPAGIPAVQQLLRDGLNVNVTLLFARSAYEAVVEAYLQGLEARPGTLEHIASVASFFVSRIDNEVDRAIGTRGASAPEDGAGPLADLKGRAGIANAKLAYQSWKSLFSGPRWDALVKRGARPQRLLWASTGTKNKAYSDVLYVEELIGASTVNTMPPATMDAFRDHGRATPALEQGVDEARAVLTSLQRNGIELDRITADLLDDGIARFTDDFDALLAGVARKRASILGSALATQRSRLAPAVDAALHESLEQWRRDGNVRRLWSRDSTLWTAQGEEHWLGWLDVIERALKDTGPLEALAGEVRDRGIRDVVLLGMGGSSLGPQVIADTLGAPQTRFHMLDSTDPAQAARLERSIDLAASLFIVASKSGSTLEPNVFMDYFYDRVAAIVGRDRVGGHFVAVTDPGSSMERIARERDFRHVYFGDPAIGGRYSVLSNFGAVPAAAIGLDVRRFWRSAHLMACCCDASTPPSENPGVRLGLTLGVLARRGYDKVTVLAERGLESAGAWLEQLIAESTGKHGLGLIPVDEEPAGPPSVYGSDRIFVYLGLGAPASGGLTEAVAALSSAGHPVIEMTLADPWQIGQLFYSWEIAIAATGAVMRLNPFDQPDVEASKVKTRALTDAFEKDGRLPDEHPFFSASGISLFADERNRAALGDAGSLTGYLRAHFGRIGPGDYAAFLAYIDHSASHREALQAVRTRVRDRKRVATCVGFGPRFLHSTGQAYKGGPNSGVFLQITCKDAADLAIPGRACSFGVVKAAQARGDFEVLAERRRRALRVHLDDVETGLAALGQAIEAALRD